MATGGDIGPAPPAEQSYDKMTREAEGPDGKNLYFSRKLIAERGLALAVYFVGNCQFLAALGAAGGQHAAAGSRLHTAAETMLVVSLSVVGLKCSLHTMLILLFVASRIWAANLESFFGIRKIPTAYLRTRRPARSGSDKAERPDRTAPDHSHPARRFPATAPAVTSTTTENPIAATEKTGTTLVFLVVAARGRTAGMPARTDFGN